MQAESWTSLWDTWKKSGIMCWVGVGILFYEFRNDGIWLLAPIGALFSYIIFTILAYNQIKKIKTGKFIDKFQNEKQKERGTNLSLIIGVVLMVGMLGFGIYIWTQINSSIDTSMTGTNSTHNCIEASGILYSDKTGIPMKLPDNIVNNAKTAWVKDSCNTVMLTDTFGNQCEGSIGLAYYGQDKDGYGQWYCSNIPKQQIGVNNIVK